MRKAIYLGFIAEEGDPIDTSESYGDYSPGDVLFVERTKDDHPKKKEYPWREVFNPQEIGYCFQLFREGELEFIPEKEFDVNDYL